MKVLIYKEDGLGDSLFCIPFLKYLEEYFTDCKNDKNSLSNKSSLNVKLYFYSRYVDLLKKIFSKTSINFITKEDIYGNYFDIVIFLGPLGRFFWDIIRIKSKKKYSVIYKNKVITNLILKFLTTEIPFEIINPVLDHEIFILFNIVFHILEKEKLIKDFKENVSYRKYENLIDLYDIDNFGDFKRYIELIVFNKIRFRDLLNENYGILHITYKSFRNGITVRDYKKLLEMLLEFVKKVFLVFGPLERDYFNLFKSSLEASKKDSIVYLIDLSLEEYIALCYKSEIFIGFDTGACHLASFSNTKRVISFYPDKIFRYNSIRYSPINKFSKIINLPYSAIYNNLEKLILSP